MVKPWLDLLFTVMFLVKMYHAWNLQLVPERETYQLYIKRITRDIPCHRRQRRIESYMPYVPLVLLAPGIFRAIVCIIYIITTEIERLSERASDVVQSRDAKKRLGESSRVVSYSRGSGAISRLVVDLT